MSFAFEDVRFDERGLVPAVVQDARTRRVLTLAYMNEESLRRTLAEGETWFWSRSRSELWHKGATSGNTQRVVDLKLDCDGDAILVLVEPRGPACHTGARSCFGGGVEGGDGDFGAVLEKLYSVVEGRRRERPEGSYTTYLFEQGLNKILKKVGEESAETIIAAKEEDTAALTGEMADLIYHLVVLSVERHVTLGALATELSRRSQEKGKK